MSRSTPSALKGHLFGPTPIGACGGIKEHFELHEGGFDGAVNEGWQKMLFRELSLRGVEVLVTQLIRIIREEAGMACIVQYPDLVRRVQQGHSFERIDPQFALTQELSNFSVFLQGIRNDEGCRGDEFRSALSAFQKCVATFGFQSLLAPHVEEILAVGEGVSLAQLTAQLEKCQRALLLKDSCVHVTVDYADGVPASVWVRSCVLKAVHGTARPIPFGTLEKLPQLILSRLLGQVERLRPRSKKAKVPKQWMSEEWQRHHFVAPPHWRACPENPVSERPAALVTKAAVPPAVKHTSPPRGGGRRLSAPVMNVAETVVPHIVQKKNWPAVCDTWVTILIRSLSGELAAKISKALHLEVIQHLNVDLLATLLKWRVSAGVAMYDRGNLLLTALLQRYLSIDDRDFTPVSASKCNSALAELEKDVLYSVRGVASKKIRLLSLARIGDSAFREKRRGRG